MMKEKKMSLKKYSEPSWWFRKALKENWRFTKWIYRKAKKKIGQKISSLLS